MVIYDKSQRKYVNVKIVVHMNNVFKNKHLDIIKSVLCD